MKSTKREGFTLVELLIVIVVIGILSAMMMLSSTEAVSSAKANNIISNLRNMKTAVTAWYVDNIDKVVKDGTNNDGSGKYYIDVDGTNTNFTNFVKDHSSEFLKYFNNESSMTLKGPAQATNAGDYTLKDVDRHKWYVYYNVGSDAKVKEKLAGRAKSLGLVGASEPDNHPVTDSAYYTNQKVVGMLILDLAQ